MPFTMPNVRQCQMCTRGILTLWNMHKWHCHHNWHSDLHIIWSKCCWRWQRGCWWENPVWSTVVQYFCRLIHRVVEVAAELHSLDVQCRHDHLPKISIFIGFMELQMFTKWSFQSRILHLRKSKILHIWKLFGVKFYTGKFKFKHIYI